jgi:hypothetical protein
METKITESTSPNYNGPTDSDNDPMVRIAAALEEILRLVKADQAKTAERMKEYDNE